MNTIKPNNSKLALALTAVAGITIAASAALAEYSGGSWYPHPPLTSEWQFQTSKTSGAFSAQNCIVDYGGQRRQAAVIVRNNDHEAEHPAEVIATYELTDYPPPNYVERVTRGDMTCSRSRVGANDYSVCFSDMVLGEGWLSVHSKIEIDSGAFEPAEISAPSR